MTTEFRSRLELAKRYPPVNVNCHGTVLYFLGRKHIGRCTTYIELLDYLDPTPLEAPKMGSVGLVVSKSYGFFVPHSGIVTDINPVLLTHRNGTDGPVIENEPVTDVLKRYRRSHGTGITMEYRMSK